eukprot:scaffold413021_cov31-Prasinocladus_malaysianus.AAC.1
MQFRSKSIYSGDACSYKSLGMPARAGTAKPLHVVGSFWAVTSVIGLTRPPAQHESGTTTRIQ